MTATCSPPPLLTAASPSSSPSPLPVLHPSSPHVLLLEDKGAKLSDSHHELASLVNLPVYHKFVNSVMNLIVTQSEEDLALKQQLELYVERVPDADPSLQKVALESMRVEQVRGVTPAEIRTVTLFCLISSRDHILHAQISGASISSDTTGLSIAHVRLARIGQEIVVKLLNWARNCIALAWAWILQQVVSRALVRKSGGEVDLVKGFLFFDRLSARVLEVSDFRSIEVVELFARFFGFRRIDNYLSEVCNQGLLSCVERFKKSGSKTFKGNTCDANDVTNTISLVMDAAVLAGRYIHKPSN
ncbi:phospholipase A2-alpha [Tanacetum coccineum]